MSRGTRQNPQPAPGSDVAAAQQIVDLQLALAAVTAERDELERLIKPTSAWFDVDGERVRLTGPSLKILQRRNPGAVFRGYCL